MNEFKEIEIYKPKSKLASEWEINAYCSDTTKHKLNNFHEKCDELEAIFSNHNCELSEFFWFTSDDDVLLSIEFSLDQYENYKQSIPELIDFFSERLPCIDDSFRFLEEYQDHSSSKRSYVSIGKSKVGIQIELDWRSWNSYIPTPDYFYASM